MKNNLILTAFFLLALALAACAPTAAGEISAFNPDLGATVQYDQYLRDAAATGTSRAVQFAIDIQNVQATAANATSTAYANATATAIDNARMTEQSHANATSTAVVELQMTEQAHASATATAVLAVEATRTAAIEATRVQIALNAEQADADRARWVADIAWGLRLIAAAVILFVLAFGLFVLIQVFRKRKSMFTHGPFGAPVFMLDTPHGQAIIDPLRLPGPAVVVDGNAVTVPQVAAPEDQARAVMGAIGVALAQAQHSPYPPPPPAPVALETTERLKVGAVEREKTTRPVALQRVAATAATPRRPDSDASRLPAASAIAEGDGQLPIGDGDTIEGRWREVKPAGAIVGWVDEAELQLLESGPSARFASGQAEE